MGHVPHAEVSERRHGWRRALALFAIVMATSVVRPGVLIALPLLILIGLGGIRGVATFVATVLAMLFVLSGPRDGMWYAERAWALMVGGIFTGLALAVPSWKLSSRSLASVMGAAVMSIAFLALRADAWSTLDWSVGDRLRGGFATSLDALTVLRQGEAPPASLVSAIYRTVEAQIAVFPALLALQSMAALAVVWWLYVRVVHRSDSGLAPLRGFRFNDHLVWLMIFGLVLVVARVDAGLTRVGANLAVFMGALYSVRGTAVIVFASGGLSLVGYTMFALGLLTAAPVLFGLTALIGIADTWLDLRARVASVST